MCQMFGLLLVFICQTLCHYVDVLSGAMRHLFQVTDVHDAVTRMPVGMEFECNHFASHFS